ncbi:MAG: hypothetical protein RMJ98_12640 [Myxococcales bacterium]|nr:hypothetical protein [Polyangiaceae bacterium]MDW8250134.1 hypothetical protein [Myxococcales bacterium]
MSPSELHLAPLALVFITLACCSPRSPSYPTTDRLEPSRRLPDGVALDPLPAPVSPVLLAEAPSPWSVALLPPLPVEAALHVLRRVLNALVSEDLSEIQPLLAPRSSWLNPQSNSSAPLLHHFRERIRRLDYEPLASSPLLRESDTEVFTPEDLDALLPGRPRRPPEMQPGDVLLRVRILTPRVGADRLFGDELLVMLRPERGGYLIQRWQEEFQLP